MPPIAAPAPRRPNPPSPPADAAPHPHPWLISSLPPHPRDLNLEFFLTLETGLPAGVEDDGPWFGSPPVLACRRFYRPWEPVLAHDIKDRSWPSPFTGSPQDRRRRAISGTPPGVFAGSPDGREEPLDAAVSATAKVPAPTPQYSRT
jgi:hypothetical protein